MAATERRYSKEEFARRGDAIYQKEILPKLAAKDVGKFLAIDIETGEYEMAADELKAGNKLLTRLPNAQIWMVRIGYAATHSFGGRQVRQDLAMITGAIRVSHPTTSKRSCPPPATTGSAEARPWR